LSRMTGSHEPPWHGCPPEATLARQAAVPLALPAR
jgi:hypothetical protein